MNSETTRLSRRDVLKYFAAVSAALATNGIPALAGPAKHGPTPTADGIVPIPNGYGTDPDLVKFYKPGDVWPLTFTAEQRKTADAFADSILPADEFGPSASSLRVTDYIDEWISAPYETHNSSRKQILSGLAWLDRESRDRFQNSFAGISDEQQRAILDDICDEENAKPDFKNAAKFFATFRSLACGAYYATLEGWKAIGYVGNVPLASFEGPLSAVLAKLGLEQTVH
jgi:hypothetical protein